MKQFLITCMATAWVFGFTPVTAQTQLRKHLSATGPAITAPSLPIPDAAASAALVSAGQNVRTGSGTQISASYGTKIGQTYYDLQSNQSTANRLVRDAAGNLHATWVESCTPDPGGLAFPYRGAGYNYFDGNTWVHGPDGTCNINTPDPEQGGTAASQYGIFSTRLGWPEMLVFPSGKEHVIGHTPLQYVSRPQVPAGTDILSFSGSTPFCSSPGPGDTWPRAVSVGSNVYMIASNTGTVNGVTGGIAFYRSTDEGRTFTEVLLPGHSTTFFPSGFGGDGYAIHANGNTVAITGGGFADDWVMWKSTNAGVSFTKTTLRHSTTANLYTDANGNQVFDTNDKNFAVLVDHSGRVHCFAGYILGTQNTTTGDLSSYYPLVSEGIWYWNDNSFSAPQLIVSAREDVPGVTWIGDGTAFSPTANAPYGNGLLSMPTAALGPNNDIYLVYSGIVEGTSNTGTTTGQSYRDLYVMRGANQGQNWSAPRNIASQIANVGRTNTEEDVFPSVAHEIGPDNLLHLLWQSDNEPGLYVRIDNDPQSLNEIMHFSFNVAAVFGISSSANDVGVAEIVSPGSGCNLGNQQVCVAVSNYGTTSRTNVPVQYQLNGGTVVTGTVPGPIAPGATVTFCFSQNAAFSAAGNYTLTATTNLGTDANAVNNSQEVSIRNNSGAAPIINGLASSYCLSAPAVTLQGNGTCGIFSGTGVTGTSFSPSAAGIGTHTITYSVGGSCPGTVSQTVTVNNGPAVTAGPDQSTCISAAPFQLTGFSPAGGTWSGPGVSASGLFNPATAGTGTKTLTYTVNSGGCSGSATKAITVNGTATAAAGNDQTACSTDAPFQLTGFSPAGGTWSGQGVSASGLFSPASAGTGSVTLTYTVTATGCSSSDTKVITVTAPPVVNAGAAQSICVSAAPVQLTGFSPAGGTWSGPGVSASGLFNPATAGVGSTTLTYTLTTGGCSASATKVITVNGVANVDAGLNQSVCANSAPFVLSGFSPVGGTWSGPGVSSGGVFTPTAALTGTQTLTYTVSQGGCSSTDTKTITVDAVPAVVAGGNITVCADAAPFVLNGFSPAGGTWSGSGVTTAGTFTPAQAIIGQNTLTYSITVNGCTGTDIKIVTVNALPATPGITQLSGDTLQSTVTGTTYEWKLNGNIIPFTTRKIKAVQTGNYTVRVQGANTCYSAPAAPFSFTVTGVTDELAQDVSLLPNPTTGLVEVTVTGHQGQAVSLVLVTLTGQTIKQLQLPAAADRETVRLDLSAMARGIYLIHVQVGNQIIHRKVVLQ